MASVEANEIRISGRHSAASQNKSSIMKFLARPLLYLSVKASIWRSRKNESYGFGIILVWMGTCVDYLVRKGICVD